MGDTKQHWQYQPSSVQLPIVKNYVYIHKHYYTHFLQLQLAVCDLYRTGNKEYVLKLYKDPHPRPGIVNMVEVLHRFMASPAVTPTRVE